MALLKVVEYQAGAATSGISISQGETKGNPFFRIGFTLAAQKEFFGEPLDPERHSMEFTVNDAPLHLHLMGIKVREAGALNGISLKSGTRSSVHVRVATWKPAQGKHPSVELPIINRQVSAGGISVKLPDWARPAPDPKAPR